MKSISKKDFLSLYYNETLNNIDIRPANIFKKHNILNSINIKENLLLKYPSRYLTFNQTYYIICSKGISSSHVVTILNNKGFNTISVTGGYDNLFSN